MSCINRRISEKGQKGTYTSRGTHFKGQKAEKGTSKGTHTLKKRSRFHPRTQIVPYNIVKRERSENPFILHSAAFSRS